MVMGTLMAESAVWELRANRRGLNWRGRVSCMQSCEEAAERGDVEAQLRIGEALYFGDGVPSDYSAALRWFMEAARLGNAVGQYYAASMYKEGKGTKQDDAEAFRLYLLSARQGHRDAQYMVGMCYLVAGGVERDCFEGRKWLTKAAFQGDGDARSTLSQFMGTHGLLSLEPTPGRQ